MLVIVCLLLCALQARGQTVDEGALFADTVTVVDSSLFTRDNSYFSPAETASVAFSGDVTTAAVLTAKSHWFTNKETRLQAANTRFGSFTVGRGILDVRLHNGFKAYGSVEACVSTDSTAASLSVPELFVDANVGHRVYFRAGKQVLKWGRCFFWNPTDLVNVEKKTFIKKIGSLEGAYSLKTHVPFGAAASLYGVGAVHNVARVDSIAVSIKAEVLVGGTEVALSMWSKKGAKPMYGLDISSRVAGIDLAAELGIFQEYPIRRAAIVNAQPTTAIVRVENWVPKIAVSGSKWFTVQGVPDRLMVNGEFYYNHVGSSVKKITLAQEVMRLLQEAGEENISLEPTDIQLFLASGGLYEPHHYSRYYGAIFTSLSRFIVSDLAISFNGIVNFDQLCTMVSCGLDYRMLNNFSLNLVLTGFLGPSDTEYTLAGDAMQVLLTAGIGF